MKQLRLAFGIFIFGILAISKLSFSGEFEKASELYFQGKGEQAISQYQELLKKKPGNLEGWVNLALMARDAGLYEQAISYLKHALSIYPQKPSLSKEVITSEVITSNEILNLLAWIYFYTIDFNSAENIFRKILSSEPRFLSALFGLGRVNIEKKNWTGAEKTFKKIIAHNPDFALGYYFLGFTYENLNRFEEAVQMYQQTLKTDSNLVEIYSSLGQVYKKQRNYEESYKQYRKILDIDPLHSEAKRKREEIVPLLARPPEEITPKKKITLFSSIKPTKEKAKIPILRIGTGSDEKGAPYPTEKMVLKLGSNFLLVRKKNGKVIFQGKVQSSTGAVNILQIQMKKPRKMEIFDAGGKSLGKYKEAMIVRLENPEKGTIVVEEVPYGKGFAWASMEDREYRGEIEIIPDKRYGLISVNIINLEEYLYSVLPSEMYPSAPQEALKAQAVVARTVALFKQKYHKLHENFGYDLCDEQHCQVYRGVKKETEKARQAVDETRGEILTDRDKMINALYSANCGGHTQSTKELKGWSDEPYLTGVFDGETSTPSLHSPYELEKWIKSRPQVYCNYQAENFQPTKFRWLRIIPAKEIEEHLNHQYPLGKIKRIVPLARSKSGHLREVRIVGEKGEVILDKEYEIRKFLGLGFLRSALFILETKFNTQGSPEEFIFWGGGWGHGVGMCQFGACGMTEKGYGYKEILKHYYRGTEIHKLEY